MKRQPIIQLRQPDRVYSTLDAIEDAYEGKPMVHGMSTFIGVQVTITGVIEWFQWSDRLGGFVNAFDTLGPGYPFMSLRGLQREPTA